MGTLGRDRRLCKLQSLEFGSFELRPGGTLRLGRHKDNDIHMSDSAISRFHARITWDKEMDRPVVFDNGSQNGTKVDGEAVGTAAPLRDQCQVSVGDYVINITLEGVEGTPAVLKDTGDMVTLFSDDGPDLEGDLTSRDAIRELLERVETERRTGTLFLNLVRGGRGQITYCLGRVMAADLGDDDHGLRALEKILRAAGGRFRFSSELEPREDAMNLWISDFLRSRNLDTNSQVTQSFRATEVRKLFKGKQP